MTSSATADKPPIGSWLPGMVALAAIWGCSFLLIAVGVRELHPAYLALGRVAAGALTLVAVLVAARQRLPRSPALWGHFFALGAFGVVIPWTLFGYGEQRIPSLLAGIWNGTTPLIVLPIAVLVFRTERFTAQRTVGLILGFVGVLVLLGVWQADTGAALAGQLMCFGAAICYGIAIPYQRRFVAGVPISGLTLSAGMLVAATVELAVIAPLIAWDLPPAPWTLSLPALASVLILGALGSGLAFVINLRNIRIVGASTASMVTYLIPLFAIVVGVLVLDERLEWFQPVGAVIVLAGVAVSQGLLWSSRSAAGTQSPQLPASAGETR